MRWKTCGNASPNSNTNWSRKPLAPTNPAQRLHHITAIAANGEVHQYWLTTDQEMHRFRKEFTKHTGYRHFSIA